jgi:hypothetical protein
MTTVQKYRYGVSTVGGVLIVVGLLTTQVLLFIGLCAVGAILLAMMLNR